MPACVQVKISNGLSLTFDAILIEGDIVADESSLTGEPLPVRKFSVCEDGGVNKNNKLFAGSKIVQIQGTDIESKAIILRASFLKTSRNSSL